MTFRSKDVSWYVNNWRLRLFCNLWHLVCYALFAGIFFFYRVMIFVIMFIWYFFEVSIVIINYTTCNLKFSWTGCCKHYTSLFRPIQSETEFQMWKSGRGLLFHCSLIGCCWEHTKGRFILLGLSRIFCTSAVFQVLKNLNFYMQCFITVNSKSSKPIRRVWRRGKRFELLFTVVSWHDNCFIWW